LSETVCRSWAIFDEVSDTVSDKGPEHRDFGTGSKIVFTSPRSATALALGSEIAAQSQGGYDKEQQQQVEEPHAFSHDFVGQVRKPNEEWGAVRLLRLGTGRPISRDEIR
jgi:hypothetical protein